MHAHPKVLQVTTTFGAPESTGDSPPSYIEEAHLFRRVRHQIWATQLRQLIRRSFLRVMLVCCLTIGFWGVMFVLFYEGFSLLTTAISHPPTLARTVHAVYNVFFLSLLVMLTVSSGILYYAAIYKSPEVHLLLTLPVRPRRLALEKFTETTLLACWGFVLLGSPLLVAYGFVTGAPAAYFVLLLPLLVCFAVIPSGVGAIGCLLLVSIAPRFRRAVLAVVAVAMIAGGLYLTWVIMGHTEHHAMSALWLQSTLLRLRVAEQRVLPSWWLSTGLLEAAHGGPNGVLQSLGFFWVLLSNALLIPHVLGGLGHWLLRRSFGQLSSGPRLSLPWQAGWVDSLIKLLLSPLSPTMRLVLIKDLRLFRRDPLQWSQFLLFFGLLSFYFVYVRRFDYGRQLTGWMTAIGFMNLGVVGLILSTFTTRFVFPLISIEGQRFWILGTAPVDRREILWSKFLFATIITSLPCCLLVFLSDVALQLWQRTPGMVLVHQLICLLLASGLSALSVGLGARLPELRECSPAKIAAGFGGTLTLILSALYVIAVVLPPAIPAYVWYAQASLARPPGTDDGGLQFWFLMSIAAGLLVTATTVLIPLRIGFRAFARLELV
jgi:ABC-2 type transport system permease protein